MENNGELQNLIADYLYKFQVVAQNEHKYSDTDAPEIAQQLKDNILTKANKLDDVHLDTNSLEALVNNASDEVKLEAARSAENDIKSGKAPTFIKVGGRWLI